MEASGNVGRPGRWRSGAKSRQRILETARTLFGEHGYGGTTVRAVAAQADVDPAMVFYFFGNKQGLFAAATAQMSAQVPGAIDSIFDGNLDGIGERLVRTLLENHDTSQHSPLVLLAQAAPAHDESAALLREFIDQEIKQRLAALLDVPDASLRVGMVSVQILGLVMARHVARVEPIASASVDELVARFGPIVQECLTGVAVPS
jgi:AcrR family transcriptional regulator